MYCGLFSGGIVSSCDRTIILSPLSIPLIRTPKNQKIRGLFSHFDSNAIAIRKKTSKEKCQKYLLIEGIYFGRRGGDTGMVSCPRRMSLSASRGPGRYRGREWRRDGISGGADWWRQQGIRSSCAALWSSTNGGSEPKCWRCPGDSKNRGRKYCLPRKRTPKKICPAYGRTQNSREGAPGGPAGPTHKTPPATLKKKPGSGIP